jgi:hypothetical protein
MLEALGAFIAALTLILQRKDRAQDKSEVPDAQALLELYTLLDEWATRLRETNTRVVVWVREGRDVQNPKGIWEAHGAQYARIKDFDENFGELSNARKLLGLYIPNVNQVVDQLVNDRKAQLDTLVTDLVALHERDELAFEEMKERLFDQDRRMQELLVAFRDVALNERPNGPVFDERRGGAGRHRR